MNRAVRNEKSGIFAMLDTNERYELGKVLGEGGMGQVVEAFDRQLDRKVALKFLTYPDPDVLEMFQTEARSQARVQHDHVLEVYDIGELDGRPFISMRHLPGKNLEQRRKELSLESIVRLLAQTAEGLHAAHREGLLHHDVKPSNVLVGENQDGDLVAYISDFGVASRAEESSSVAGTPSYLAPERVSHGDIDRRSDIYSLGITLYEMFTGEVPFRGSAPLDLFHKIANEPPTPPRSHRPSLPVELEAIVMRCIAKNPDHRYASARAVAEDLHRYLDGEAVEAYTAGLAYRLTRFVLRNKVLVAMGCVALVALVISSVAVAIFAFQAESARRHAEAARVDAEQRRGQAEKLIGFMVGNLQGKLKELGRLDVLDEVGDEALEYFASVPQDELTVQELLWRSQMLYQIGEVRVRQGKFSEALAPMEESLALAERLVELSPEDPDRMFALGQSHFWVGFVHWKKNDINAALGPMESYLKVSQQLLSKDPSRAEWQVEEAYAHNNVAMLLQIQNEIEAALLHLQRAAEIARLGLEKDPSSEEWQSVLWANKGKSARAFFRLGRFDQAQQAYEEELALVQALAERNPQDATRRRPIAVCTGALGELHLLNGRLELAREYLGRSTAIYLSLLEIDPNNDDFQRQLNWLRMMDAKMAWIEGNRLAARELWRDARAQAKAAFDAAPGSAWRSRYADLTYQLAWAERLDNPGFAAELVESAIRDLTPDGEGSTAEMGVTRWVLAKSYLLAADLIEDAEEAKALAAKALRLVEGQVREGRAGEILAPYAEALLRLDRPAEAKEAIAALRDMQFTDLGFRELCRRESISCFSDGS